METENKFGPNRNLKNSKFWEVFWLKIIFLFGGFLSGFLALILSIVVQFASPSQLILPSLLVISEEISKFILIFFLLNKIKVDLSKIALVLNCILLGIGFGGFEFMLIYFGSKPVFQNLIYIAPIFLIHVITSILIGLGLSDIKRKPFLAYSLYLSAFLVHLVYNLTIINNFNLHF